MDNTVKKFRIFRKYYPKRDGSGSFTKYSTKVSKKVGDNDWQNEFITVEFRIKGGANLQHGTDIEVPAESWGLSFNSWNDDYGNKHVEWIVCIYEYRVVNLPQNNGNGGNGNSYRPQPQNAPQGNYGANNGYPQNNPQPQQSAFGDFNDIGFSAADDSIPF